MAKTWNAIRPDASGDIDDVAITGDLFRMERMDDHTFWVCIYRGDKRTSFYLSAKAGKLEAHLQEDGVGCVNDNDFKSSEEA